MDFQLSEDQRDLRSGVREFCEGRFGRDRMRALLDTAPVPGMVDRALWRELADTGFFSLRVAEDAGGVGLGVAEAALVYEEAGRVLLPGPLVATHLAASLPGEPGAKAAAGDAVVGLIEGDSWPLLIEHLDALDCLLVLTDEGIRRVDPGAVRGVRVAHPVDPFTPVTSVDELPVGELVADALVADQWRRIGAVLTGALQLGIAGRLTELATRYAKEREQFGRVIGGFQAVKHLCADMLVRTELARAAVYAAAVTLDDPAVGDPEVAVLTAKVMGDDAATRNGKDATQVHGGMGFTWEVDVHLYLKRAWVHATQFGGAEENEEALAATL
ncbi:acyl-CoA dehydrogenase family protein [Embleya scabrispora]|uniref:acyl-CoA dehydrogenase family protein n=1 Tax=Embleya scabrispora TaxID=159449 RepID=UPI00036016F4|nr:acyl-CoA dehydrogenase family protein [Embleya scabrispora]MYS81332.1 acyl-CoA dehydrogenase [Streptomyces sp. SID5474]